MTTNIAVCNATLRALLDIFCTGVAYIDDTLCDVIGCRKYDTTAHTAHLQ